MKNNGHTQLKFMIFLILSAFCVFTSARTINFSNIKWDVHEGYGFPGPNNWSGSNVMVDENGWLHLRISYEKGKWYSSGISTQSELGFGKYWFYIIGRLDKLQPNVTLALFSYPSIDNEPDQTNEIDIEFFKQELKTKHSLDTVYTVWPTQKLKARTALNFKLDYAGTNTTHGYIWNEKQVQFLSSSGHYSDYKELLSNWLFKPVDYELRIPQSPLRVYIYFYLNKGKEPENKTEMFEIIIRKFCYESESKKMNSCISNP